MFPAARRALRERARRADAADLRATLEAPEQNRLLAALPRAEHRRLLSALEPVTLAAGDVLHEAGAPIRHVYFPVDCVVCLLTEVDGPQTVATGLVGREGMVGMPLAMGVGASVARAVVQIAGTALRMSAARFSTEFQRGLPLQQLLYRHAQVELNLARQTAACIASHRFEQRLACWLLMIGDRAASQEMLLTQGHLAADLNVRRVSVTSACVALRSLGLIGYSRGRLSILDRKGLESVACHCYRPIDPADAARRPGGMAQQAQAHAPGRARAGATQVHRAPLGKDD
ncbi:Crp/Fnr family transcriptional regulator [Ideonella sp. A 288]|uniref:Crp/Fnr family transcriptional regulator n=1 Tax=Ideonella sp. A 288 TaxID=1962181 RepID=UPI001F342825|nr:Crp/Fnr family transcriptional regulator [Ideonella sp. A 288]